MEPVSRHRRRTIVVAVLSLLVIVPTVGAGRAAVVPPGPSPMPGCAEVGGAGGEWRSYGHDSSNTRHQDRERALDVDEAATLAPTWTFSVNGAGGAGDFTGTPIVADGCVYAGSNGGWVFALNADTGELVWKAEVPEGGNVNATVAVDSGSVYVAVSRVARSECGTDCEGPYVVAFDQATGALRWQSEPIDSQAGADVYGSPVVYDGLLFMGVSGGSAELGDETDRYAFQGSFVLLDAASGALVTKTWTIHPPHTPEDDFAGAGVWSTPAIDEETGYAYVGTANPFKPQDEHANANAVIKVDLDRSRPTFGQIVASGKGNVDEYFGFMKDIPCSDLDGNAPPWYPQGVGACGDIDLDFGASPNLFVEGGRKLVGAGQKSGVYHVWDAETMAPVWNQIVGPPSSVGGIVGSTAIDANGIYGPVTVPGYVWSLQRGGAWRWSSPTADAVHWGNPVAVANGVVYTVDLKGFLDAYDHRLGTPVLHRPIVAGADTGGNPASTWGGVSIARHTVYAAVGIQGLPDGFIVAFKPGATGGGGGPGVPDVPGAPGVPGGNTVVAGPGAVATTYATTTVTIQQGQSLSFTNLDVPQHDVDGDGGAFESDLIGPGETTDVRGASSLAPGSYGFYCSLHRNMTGTLIVQ